LLAENCHISPEETTDLPVRFNDVDEDLWRAKVSAYVAWLQKQLDSCDELGPEAASSWRSRVEALSPALEHAFERRRVALEPPVEVPVDLNEAHGTGTSLADPEEMSTVEGRIGQHDAAGGYEARDAALQNVIAAIDAGVEPPVVVSPLPADAAIHREEPTVTAAVRVNTPAVPANPFSRPAGRKPRDEGIDYQDARAQMEEEMVELVQTMKIHSTNMLGILKKDNKELSEMEDLQQRGLDKVQTQNAKGKKMMRSGQLGFLCTMIMVVISVVIFFMMIPFIIFT